MEKKSLAANATLNIIRNISNIVFPLITFPYVSRVLGVYALGQYNFAYSIVSYFVLLAGLGVSTYAIREGSRIRDDRNSLSIFASEMLLINLLSTLFSYVVFFVCVSYVSRLYDYKLLLLVFSIQLFANTMSVEWLYSIYEDYQYITVRTLVFKFVSLILIFLFVREDGDVINYAIVMMFALSGSSILNFYHSKLYCDFNLFKVKELRKHLGPVLTLFSSSIAVMIYVYSDTTILGFLKTDYEVGLYSLSSKIYITVKSILSAIIIVLIPRLSALFSTNKTKEYNHILQKLIDFMTIILLPCVVGIFVLSKNIVALVGGIDYLDASSSLRWLSVALLFCLYGWIFNQGVLLPTKNEKTTLFATVSSALLNIVINFIFIPSMGGVAAAVSTAVAELFMLIVCYYKGRTYFAVSVLNKNLFQVILACVTICGVCVLSQHLFVNNLITVVFAILLSLCTYSLTLILQKNVYVNVILNRVKSYGDCILSTSKRN